MTREEIKEQGLNLAQKAIEFANSDNEWKRGKAQTKAEESRLLLFAAENATDEDLRLAQIVLPGRCSVMRWAKENGGN